MRNILLAGILAFAFTQSYAQSLSSEIQGLPWRLIPSVDNSVSVSRNVFRTSLNPFDNARIYINSNEVIAAVGLGREQTGIVRLTNDAKIKWTTTLQGFVLGIAKIKDKIVAFTSDGIDKQEYYNNVYNAILINPETGKQEQRKNIFRGDDDALMEPKIFSSSNGSFLKFGIRTQADKKKAVRFFSNEEAFYKTTDFSIFNIDEKLNITSSKIQVPEDSKFSTCANDNNGNIYTVFDDDGEISINKYDAQNKMSKVANVSIDLRKNKTDRVFAKVINEKLYVSVVYENKGKDDAYTLYEFDVKSGAKKESTLIMDKAFRKKTSSEYVVLDKKLDDYHPLNWYSFYTVDIQPAGDKVIVLLDTYTTEISTTKSYDPNSTKHITTDALLLIFSDINKQPAVSMIPKVSECFSMPLGMLSSMHIKDNRVYYTATETKVLKDMAVTGYYDLKEMKMMSMMTVEKKDIPNLFIVDPAATLWFENNYLVPALDQKGFFKIKEMPTSFQNFTY